MKPRPRRVPLEELRRHQLSMTPGTLGGRLAAARPISSEELDIEQTATEEGSDEQPTIKFWQDKFVVSLSGNQYLPLTHLPINNSEHLYWGRLYQRGSFWTRVEESNIVNVIDPNNELRPGDTLTIEYSYGVV